MFKRGTISLKKFGQNLQFQYSVLTFIPFIIRSISAPKEREDSFKDLWFSVIYADGMDNSFCIAIYIVIASDLFRI